MMTQHSESQYYTVTPLTSPFPCSSFQSWQHKGKDYTFNIIFHRHQPALWRGVYKYPWTPHKPERHILINGDTNTSSGRRDISSLSQLHAWVLPLRRCVFSSRLTLERMPSALCGLTKKSSHTIRAAKSSGDWQKPALTTTAEAKLLGLLCD